MIDRKQVGTLSKAEEKAPCHKKAHLFFASVDELTRPELSQPHTEALALCRTCPVRRLCATDGVFFQDRHTVRCGLRLWLPEERARLRFIAEGIHQGGPA